MKVKEGSSEAKPEEKVTTERAKYEALKEMNAGGFLSEPGKKELAKLEAQYGKAKDTLVRE